MTESEALELTCEASCLCSNEGQSAGLAYHDRHCPFVLYPIVRKRMVALLLKLSIAENDLYTTRRHQ